MLDCAFPKIPTREEAQAADALINPILTSDGMGETLRSELEKRAPFQDPLDLEIALGRSAETLAGSLPSGSLLHLAASVLIEDEVIAVHYRP